MNLDQYVGVPFALGGKTPEEGLDCWSLCRHVLGEHFGVSMDLLEGIAVDLEDRAEEFKAVSGYNDWVPVSGSLLPGDVVFFHSKKTGDPQHIGLYVGSNLVLHTMEQGGRGSQIQRLGLLKPYFQKFAYYRNKHATNYSST
jgi:cell wall-associated NlpC family hydrolase